MNNHHTAALIVALAPFALAAGWATGYALDAGQHPYSSPTATVQEAPPTAVQLAAPPPPAEEPAGRRVLSASTTSSSPPAGHAPAAPVRQVESEPVSTTTSPPAPAMPTPVERPVEPPPTRDAPPVNDDLDRMEEEDQPAPPTGDPGTPGPQGEVPGE